MGDLGDKPYVTYGVIGICLVIFVLQTANGQIWPEGLLWGPLVQSGEWWRIVTSAFTHASLIHVGFNCFMLYVIGSQLERILGWVRFGLLYAGGLAGGAFAVLYFDFMQATVGASGAVLGLGGAMAAMVVSRGGSIVDTPMAGTFLLNLVLPLISGLNISFWGHLGGVIGGFIAGIVLMTTTDRVAQSLRGAPRSGPEAPSPAVRHLPVMATAAVVLLLFGAAWWAASTGDIVTIR